MMPVISMISICDGDDAYDVDGPQHHQMLMGLNIINIEDDDGWHLKKNVGMDAACGWRNAAKRVSNLLKSNNLGLI